MNTTAFPLVLIGHLSSLSSLAVAEVPKAGTLVSIASREYVEVGQVAPKCAVLPI